MINTRTCNLNKCRTTCSPVTSDIFVDKWIILDFLSVILTIVDNRWVFFLDKSLEMIRHRWWWTLPLMIDLHQLRDKATTTTTTPMMMMMISISDDTHTCLTSDESIRWMSLSFDLSHRSSLFCLIRSLTLEQYIKTIRIACQHDILTLTWILMQCLLHLLKYLTQ
jgi:hypothetical protein